MTRKRRPAVFRCRPCSKCGDHYQPRSSQQRVCDACLSRICSNCGEAFLPSRRYTEAIYCSDPCRAAQRKKKRPAERVVKFSPDQIGTFYEKPQETRERRASLYERIIAKRKEFYSEKNRGK
jgi:hypothetical protein